MNKVVVLYWEPGSCGDFIHSTMLAREYSGIINGFSVDVKGRTVPNEAVQFFKDNFKCTDNLWYELEWDHNKVELLMSYLKENDIKQFVIPTHKFKQVQVLKKLLPDIVSAGVVYPENMYPLVLKNWCKKVGAKDSVLKEIYNKPFHQALIKNNTFGEYILSEQLKFGSQIRTSVPAEFDVNISLESLFIKDLTSINSLFVDSSHVDSLFNGWFKHQNPVHKYHYDGTALVKNALGFNSLARADSDDINLDTFDNILLNYHHGSKHKFSFKTLSQATIFFKDHTQA